MNLLEIEGLEAGYGAQAVLHGLNLTVGEGTFAALVGPNGHGKSTALRTISGLMRARAGSIRFAGARIDRLRPDQIVAEGIIHVPHLPELTVIENLRLGAHLPKAAARPAAGWTRS